MRGMQKKLFICFLRVRGKPGWTAKVHERVLYGASVPRDETHNTYRKEDGRVIRAAAPALPPPHQRRGYPAREKMNSDMDRRFDDTNNEMRGSDSPHGITMKGNNCVNAVNGRIIRIGKDDSGRRMIRVFIRSGTTKKPTYLSFSLENISLGDIRLYDTVNVEGHWIAYKFHNEKWEDRRRDPYIQYLVADSVTISKPRMEEVYGIKGGFYYSRPYVETGIRGTIEKVEKNEKSGWVTLTVGVKEHGRRNCSIEVQYSPNMRVNDGNYEEGDKVVVLGTVYTKPVKDKDAFFENIVAEDICVLEKAIKAAGNAQTDDTNEGEEIFAGM